jgi:hypothetical protein
MGFHFAVEEIRGLEEKGQLLQTLATCIPPASPYNANNRSEHAAFVFSVIDWKTSKDNNLFYKEEDFALSALKVIQTSAVLFDVKMFDLGK